MPRFAVRREYSRAKQCDTAFKRDEVNWLSPIRIAFKSDFHELLDPSSKALLIASEVPMCFSI
jgi:hypothetical protein